MADDIKWQHLWAVLAEGAEVFLRQARANLANMGSNASGNLSATMSGEVVIDAEGYRVTITLADYWRYVDEGTRGRETGNPSRKFPPLSAIRQWIQVKPVTPRKDSRGRLPTTDQLAYLIGRKIRDYGTEATGFFREAETLTEIQFRARLTAAVKADIEEAAAEALRAAGLWG